jgi:nitrogen fixation/metabolism regulation signal transduction histidine kinase
MKTLRSKIFVFVALLLLLPAIPLSFFIMNLLERSYQIGVNKRVEEALDGGLRISADFYQLKKNRLSSLADQIAQLSDISTDHLEDLLNQEFNGSSYSIVSIRRGERDRALVPESAVDKFIHSDQKFIVWPSADRMTLYALARLSDVQFVEIVYPLPETFQTSALKIQEISQIFKTLGLVNTEIRNSFLYTFLIIYGLGACLALLVSYFISHKITRPINSLIKATNEVAAGNIDYRIEMKEDDEFHTLAKAFNHMTAELSSNQHKIIELEKMAMWQTMARRLAHEIKNPLTPIQLMAQQIVDKYPGSNQAYRNILSESYEIIEQEIESLKKLVRAFSDFARLPDFQPALHNLGQLLQTLQKLYQQADIQLNLPDVEVESVVDHDHLKRALINLIDNALAAQNGKGSISLTLKIANEVILISVADQGQGIEKEHINKIFEPYFSTKKSGVGLGLAIVKKIIEEHNGDITLESSPGSGTTFLIRLPLIKQVN